MNDELENDLRYLFASRACALPADAITRVRDASVHSRLGHHWSPKVTVGSLAGLAATTGTVVSVMVLGGAQPAFAGWTAAPTAVASPQNTSVSQDCLAQIAQSAVGADTSNADWTPVDTDVRGPYTIVVYEDGSADANATCFDGPSFTIVNAESSTNANGQQTRSGSVSVNKSSGASTRSGSGPSSVSIGTMQGNDDNGVTQMTVSHLDLDSASGGPYTLVEGQIASSVTGVTLVRSDGQDIQATTGGGWLVAWWPGNEDISSAEVTTPSGRTTETFDTTTLPPPGSAATCSSSSGSGVNPDAGSSSPDSQTCSGASSPSDSVPAAP